MNAKQLIVAAAVFVAAGSSFAADTGAAVANSTAATSAQLTTTAAALNVPVISVSKTGGRSRAEVQAEAAEFVKNYKTAFQVQLEQYKN